VLELEDCPVVLPLERLVVEGGRLIREVADRNAAEPPLVLAPAVEDTVPPADESEPELALELDVEPDPVRLLLEVMVKFVLPPGL
jgi:hypothetical protein